jgi:LPS export ABC transporter protein LptC
MFSRYSWLIVAILTLLVTITSWVAVENSQLAPNNGQVVQTGIINQLSITQMNAAGSLEFYAKSNTASQYSNGDYHFQNININYYPSDNKGQADIVPWNLTATNASLLNNSTEIDLDGQVLLSRTKDGNTPAINIATSAVSLFPQNQTMQGNQPVTITIPNTQNITTAVGITGNLKTKVINLLSNVSSYYEPYSPH